MTARILVIEDNTDNLTLITDVLTSLQYDVLSARDGLDGLEAARSEHPDLILMDMSLPRLDGWEATRRIKADPELKAIPVIALTAHAMTGDREKALEAGCDDYLSKPINLKELAAKLRHYLMA
ncbi:MAG: response regulator [Anaerolinea sp.]|nr:response regulator [Anaerolinea sp.]